MLGLVVGSAVEEEEGSPQRAGRGAVAEASPAGNPASSVELAERRGESGLSLAWDAKSDIDPTTRKREMPKSQGLGSRPIVSEDGDATQRRGEGADFQGNYCLGPSLLDERASLGDLKAVLDRLHFRLARSADRGHDER